MNRLVSLLFMVALFPSFLTGESVSDQAWKLLLNAAADSNPIRRTQALTALGTIGPERPALKAIQKGLQDKDTYVRLTAVAALGEVKSPRRIAELRRALDDDAPDVRFVAARTLWQMGNHSGREVLIRVLSGEKQKGGPGPIKGEMQAAKDKLYDRSALAKMGISEGAGALLGPFSMGVGFAEDLLKDKGAPQRAIAAELLAKDKSPKSLAELEDALTDKNDAVRAAAARALGDRRDRHAMPQLEAMLDDKSAAARFMAAATILRLTQAPVHHAAPTRTKDRRP
ncbi:MAG TPA: HEAT repeat domain-containing protein [Terriglobia bacterium]|nr:HEAT repeat domain-containing protein [Terriglobia bacterium]